MSENTSLISMHPIVQKFVLSIIKNIKAKNFDYRERTVIDADLVPKVSENTMRAIVSIKADDGASSGFENKLIVSGKPEAHVKKNTNRLTAPVNPNVKNDIARPQNTLRPTHTKRNPTLPSPPIPPAQFLNKKDSLVAPDIVSDGAIDRSGKYGKISSLLNDPSVSVIECMGTGKELIIVRMGQKQRTRITLSANEIKDILERAANEAHIPLLDGVFRASINGFSINAVISNLIDSRFIIKKAGAYNLLK